MWILTKCETGEKMLLLPEMKQYTVGRVGTNFVIKDDLCISRNHAIFHLPNESTASLSVEDVGSKYGTFCNAGIAANRKIVGNEPTSLADGDLVRFGLLKNVWQVTHYKSCILASALTRAQNEKLTKVVQCLGGKILDGWDDSCTHLTMNEVSVTIKLLYALVEQIPVVNCDFWMEFLKFAKCGIFNGDALPQPENFPPDRQGFMDLSARPERKTLFNGKTFVFMNRKHFEMYGPIVKKAGGTCKNLNNGVMKAFLTRPNVIVVQFVPLTQSQATETINSISDMLEANGLRLVPETEISLAIINCSIEKYCNPKYKIINDIIPSEPIASAIELPAGTMFAENSDAVENGTSSSTVSEIYVPETERATSKCNPQKPQLPMQSIDIDSSDDENKKESTMPSMSITESNTSPEPESPIRRKRSSAKRQAIFDTEEDNADGIEEELFQLKKKPHLEDDVEPEQPTSTRRSLRTQKPAVVEQAGARSVEAKLKNHEQKETKPTKKVTRASSKANSKPQLPKKNVDVDDSDEERQKSSTMPSVSAMETKANSGDGSPVKLKRSSAKRRANFEFNDENEDGHEEELCQLKKVPHLEVDVEQEQSTSKRRSPRTQKSGVAGQATTTLENAKIQNQSKTETKLLLKATPKASHSRLRPLEVVNVKRVSLQDFLEKSQAVGKQDMGKSSEDKMQEAPSTTNKRSIIKVLNDSDGGDDEGLFNFGGAAVPTPKKSRVIASSADESEDALFNFNVANDDAAVGDKENAIETERVEHCKIARKSGYVIHKPKQLARTVSTVGWLSCLKQEIKIGNSFQKVDSSCAIQKKEDSDSANDTSSHENVTFDYGFVVRMSNLVIERPFRDEIDASKHNINYVSTTGLKNFKKFIKQRTMYVTLQK